MKKIFFTLMGLVVFSAVSHAQNDTMYVMKKGVVLNRQSIKPADADSIIFYLPSNYFMDARDSNVYRAVTIGSQIWMGDNLKYLPSVIEPGKFSKMSPYYYVYGYDGKVVADAKATVNYNMYGVLYNWTAASSTGLTSVCPSGWHLPSDGEWSVLANFLNGETANETGFAALLGGLFSSMSGFEGMGAFGAWWSATEYVNDPSNLANYYAVYDDDSTLSKHTTSKVTGYSVRCVKN